MNHQEHHQDASKLPETAPLGRSLHPGPKMPSHMLRQMPYPSQQKPWRLMMQISGDSHSTVGLEVKDRIFIGREDLEAGTKPDLNLAPYGGNRLGVSRHHAVIILHDNSLYIEDADSTNGTRLNGYVIEPLHSYQLRDGDELEFGKVRVVIRFIRSPKLVE